MRKVVLVSLDAFFIADTEHPDPDGFLTRMMREGTFCRRVETIFPALTYPIHVTMVTGCDPNKTGVGQNQPPQPDVPKKKTADKTVPSSGPSIAGTGPYAGAFRKCIH